MFRSGNLEKQKFVIAVPGVGGSGGSIALGALCKYLNDIGYDAKIWSYQWDWDDSRRSHYIALWAKKEIKRTIKEVLRYFFHFLNLTCPAKIIDHAVISGLRYKKSLHVSRNTIVVLPESLKFKSPFHSNKVVHWLLYYPPQRAFSEWKNDLVIAYREQFNDEKLNPNHYTATVSYFDLNTYKRYNYADNRKGTCYIVRKGAMRKDIPSSFDGPIIDQLSEKEKVDCFNRYKYCVSYDTQTAYSTIAALCGCISIVVPEPGKTRMDYLTSEEIGRGGGLGVAYGDSPEEIQYAIETMNRVQHRLEKRNEDSKKDAEKFAQICIEFFNAKNNA